MGFTRELYQRFQHLIHELAKLGVVKGPGGKSQVTFGGKPLYTFVQDSPGQPTGNGAMDSFDGTSFTWTAATPRAMARSTT